MPEEYLKLSDAADYLQLTSSRVRQLIREGRLPAFQLNTTEPAAHAGATRQPSIRVRRSDIESLIVPMGAANER